MRDTVLKELRSTVLLSFTLITAVPLAGSAGVIDFETLPDGSPTSAGNDDEDVTAGDIYTVNSGSETFEIGFSLKGDGNPKLEQRGFDGDDGFVTANYPGAPGTPPAGSRDNDDPGDDRVWDIEADNAAPDETINDFFLRGANETGGPLTLVIDYISGDATMLSGEIWDIDASNNGFEQWTVTVFDDDDNKLDSVTSPEGLPVDDPDTLDGLPWVWSFSGLSAPARKVEIAFNEVDGSKTSGIGLAFDNFNVDFDVDGVATSIPAPAPIGLMGAGLFGLAAYRLARKQR